MKDPIMKLLIRFVAFLSLIFAIQCTPISLGAPFAADPAQRQQFVQSTVIGQTTLDQVRVRWGNPTGGGILVDGPYRNGGDYWQWTDGERNNYGYVQVKVDRNDIVREVLSFRVVNEQEIREDFGQAGSITTVEPAATSAATAPAGAQPAASQEDEGGVNVLGIELECLIFCI